MSLEISYLKLRVAQGFKNWLLKHSNWMSPAGKTYSFRLCGMTLTWRPNHVKPKSKPKPKSVEATREEIYIPIKEYYEIKSMFDRTLNHWTK